MKRPNIKETKYYDRKIMGGKPLVNRFIGDLEKYIDFLLKENNKLKIHTDEGLIMIDNIKKKLRDDEKDNMWSISVSDLLDGVRDIVEIKQY